MLAYKHRNHTTSPERVGAKRVSEVRSINILVLKWCTGITGVPKLVAGQHSSARELETPRPIWRTLAGSLLVFDTHVSSLRTGWSQREPPLRVPVP